MEPEIQRLLAKHKAELQAEREKAQDSTRSEPEYHQQWPWPFFSLHRGLAHSSPHSLTHEHRFLHAYGL